MDEFRLNGRVVDWDFSNTEERTVKEEEVEGLESQGYACIPFQGEYVAIKEIPIEDGTIQLQRKSDMYGRMAQRGGHTNYGYSGYFKGYVYVGGKRRALKNWWWLFPQKEHHFPSQRESLVASSRVEEIVRMHEGTLVTKCKGGFQLEIEQPPSLSAAEK